MTSYTFKPALRAVLALLSIIGMIWAAGSFRAPRSLADTQLSASPSATPAIPAGQDGSMPVGTAATTASASFSLNETLDQAAVESSPQAPDDSVGAAGGFMLPGALPGGLDHAAAGVGTRNSGSGSIRLRGISHGCVAVRAYLYWGTILNVLAIPTRQTIVFNGVQVSGSFLGSSAVPCWPGTVFVVYKASVIAHLTANINGDYDISGLPSSVTNGSSPWSAPAAAPLSEGASLVVIYSDPNVSTGSRVYLHDSPPVLVKAFSTTTINNSLSPALPSYLALKHTRLGADGQVGQDTFDDPNLTGETTTLQSTQIKGPGVGPNRDSDWNGRDGGPLNQLWDTNTTSTNDVTILNPGATTYKVVYKTQGDCFVVVAHVLTAK